MPIPWLRVLDVVVGLTDLARRVNRQPATSRESTADPSSLNALQAVTAPVEARLTGVVVAALKEAFDRDHQRLQFEREQREEERKRGERLLRLELVRQAGDRELTRLRLIAGLAALTWMGAIAMASVTDHFGSVARAMLVGGSMCLLAALASAFLAQSAVADGLAHLQDPGQLLTPPSGGAASIAALWLLVVGLAVIGISIT